MKDVISWQERELVPSLTLSGTDVDTSCQIPGELSHDTAVPEYATACGCSSEQVRAAGMDLNQQRHHGDQGTKCTRARGD